MVQSPLFYCIKVHFGVRYKDYFGSLHWEISLQCMYLNT